jgi:hypothetical protein
VPIIAEAPFSTEYLLRAEKPVFLDMSNYTSVKENRQAEPISRYGFAGKHKFAFRAISILRCNLQLFRRSLLHFAMAFLRGLASCRKSP